MCGIAGIVGRNADDVALRSAIQLMTDAIAHRGPDGEGHWVRPGVALGHRRLAIIDIGGGAQPFVADDGRTVLTFNGEIYNYRSLRKQLERDGAQFRTRSDTEVLLRAWLKWGEAALERLQGIFAFAVWESEPRRLWLVRDRLGIKPLYISTATPGLVHFSSELKGILASPFEPRKTPRPDAIVDYLTLGYVPPNKSILDDIYQMGPGEVWRLDANTLGFTKRRYWSPQAVETPDIDMDPSAAWDAIVAAVSKQMVSDVPVAAFLSGGIDSSSVTAAALQGGAEGFSAYSIAVKEVGFDESAYAAEVAAKFKLDHKIRNVDITDGADVDTIAATYDEPFADSSSIPTLSLCEFAGAGHKVALSGDGGDEIFLGYPWYFSHQRREHIRSRWGRPLTRGAASALLPLFRLVSQWRPHLRGYGQIRALASDSLEAYVLTQSIAPFVDVASLLSPSVRAAVSEYRTVDLFKDVIRPTSSQSPLVQAQLLDLNFYLAGDILTKVDRASMAFALEVRVPLLDEDIVERMLVLRRSVVAPGGRRKGLLIDAVAPRLPPSVTTRAKQGFSVPVNAWFRRGLAERLSSELERVRGENGLLDGSVVEKILGDHVAGRRNEGPLLWAVLVLLVSMRRLMSM